MCSSRAKPSIHDLTLLSFLLQREHIEQIQIVLLRFSIEDDMIHI